MVSWFQRNHLFLHVSLLLFPYSNVYLTTELSQFSEFVKHIVVDCSFEELNYFTLIKENSIDATFPNTNNLLRIYIYV